MNDPNQLALNAVIGALIDMVKEGTHPRPIELIAKEWDAIWWKELSNGDRVMCVPLLAHVALYVNPDGAGGCDERLCYASPELAVVAAVEYENTGEWRYWQKWHNRGLVCWGGYVYNDSDYQTPENALREANWITEELRIEYPYRRGPTGLYILGGIEGEE